MPQGIIIGHYQLDKNTMELECFKYKEKMSAADAVCQHPGDYCKYRTSCMIQFLSGENKNKEKKADTTNRPVKDDEKEKIK